MGMLSVPLGLLARMAVRLVVTAALSGAPALAADTGSGSRNFNPPSGVPNYFSNEAGPIVGGAAESRRGPLYSAPAARAPAAAVPAVAAAPVPQARQHIAMAAPHTRSLHGRHTAIVHTAVHGRALAHAGARAGRRDSARVTHVAARTAHASTAHASPRAAHAASRTTKASTSPHHRARG